MLPLGGHSPETFGNSASRWAMRYFLEPARSVKKRLGFLLFSRFLQTTANATITLSSLEGIKMLKRKTIPASEKLNMKRNAVCIFAVLSLLTSLTCALGCSSARTLTFEHAGTTWTSKGDFQETEGGYMVQSATGRPRGSRVDMTIYDVFVAFQAGKVARTTVFTWQDNPPTWLAIAGPLLVIGVVLYVISSAH